MSEDRVPRDVVPRPGVTREVLERLCSTAGQSVEVHIPGDVLLDADGIPAGVGPGRTESAVLMAPCITRAEAVELGIGDGDLDGLRIVDPYEGETP